MSHRGSTKPKAVDPRAQGPDAAAFGDPRAVCMRWDVPAEFEGTRADLYLSIKVGRLSRARAARIVRRGDFRTPEGTLKPSSRVKMGPVELWRIPPDSPDDFGLEPEVLVDTDALLVVNKPPDLAVHPSARYLFRTLTAWLRGYAKAHDDVLAHPSHRLDRETSGVLVCAKTKDAQRATKGAFLHRRAKKMYAAIVRGALTNDVVINAPLALQGDSGLVRIKMIVEDGGQHAVTEVTPLITLDVDGTVRTLVACFPRTGRQHQIRAHLAHVGHPLVGDKIYAMGDVFFDALTRAKDDDTHLRSQLEHPRHALHAYALSLPFEEGGASTAFIAPLADDLLALLRGISRAEVELSLLRAWERELQRERAPTSFDDDVDLGEEAEDEPFDVNGDDEPPTVH